MTESLANKANLTISDVVEAYGVTARALRFYETKGLLEPQRRGRMRVYDGADCARLDIIIRARRLGLSLDEIKTILDVGSGTTQADRLKATRAQLTEHRAAMEILQGDIDVLLEELNIRVARLDAELEKQGASIDEDDDLRARAAAFQRLGRSWLWSDAST